MDKPPVPSITIEYALELIEEIKKSNLIKKRSYKIWVYDNCFVGEEIVQWLIKSGKAKDVESALPIGQGLLDHRLAHHVADDHAFKNEYLFYRLYQDESPEVQKEAALFDERVSKSKLAGYLKLRSLHMFSSPTFFDCYVLLNVDETKKDESKASASASASASAPSVPKLKKQVSLIGSVLQSLNLTTTASGETRLSQQEETEDVKKFPGVLYIYKLRSAPTPAFKLQVQDCICNMTECVECLTGSYCFTITTNQIDSSKNSEFTLCAKNSKQMEAWMFSMQASGVTFKKVDEGIVKASSLFELNANDLITNEVIPLSKFKGKVCLVTNVASK